MATISLAKALKLKNRLVGRLNKVQSDVQCHNSILLEQVDNFDALGEFALREEISCALIELKTAIVLGNAEIQNDIIRQGELKSKLSWLSGIPTRDGQELHSYQNTHVTYVAAIKKKDIDEMSRKIEASIDEIQDRLDNFNYTKKIEVSDRCLELGS